MSKITVCNMSNLEIERKDFERLLNQGYDFKDIKKWCENQLQDSKPRKIELCQFHVKIKTTID